MFVQRMVPMPTYIKLVRATESYQEKPQRISEMIKMPCMNLYVVPLLNESHYIPTSAQISCLTSVNIRSSIHPNYRQRLVNMKQHLTMQTQASKLSPSSISFRSSSSPASISSTLRFFAGVSSFFAFGLAGFLALTALGAVEAASPDL